MSYRSPALPPQRLTPRSIWQRPRPSEAGRGSAGGVGGSVGGRSPQHTSQQLERSLIKHAALPSSPVIQLQSQSGGGLGCAGCVGAAGGAGGGAGGDGSDGGAPKQQRSKQAL